MFFFFSFFYPPLLCHPASLRRAVNLFALSHLKANFRCAQFPRPGHTVRKPFGAQRRGYSTKFHVHLSTQKIKKIKKIFLPFSRPIPKCFRKETSMRMQALRRRASFSQLHAVLLPLRIRTTFLNGSNMAIFVHRRNAMRHPSNKMREWRPALFGPLAITQSFH